MTWPKTWRQLALGWLVILIVSIAILFIPSRRDSSQPVPNGPTMTATALPLAATHPLLLKPAPDFSIDQFGGGKVELERHRGKDVVILDFWATWCAPCIKGLPVVNGVAKKYADRNVVFYAINQEEDPATIEPFLKKRNLTDLKVGLDRDGAVVKSYDLPGLPHTFIIDKKGVVRVIHVGISDDMKAQLEKEIESILAG
jgi:thiol-disulfide isomerase/thioredoxin